MKNILLVRVPPLIDVIEPDTVVHWGLFSGLGQRQGEVHVSTIAQLREDWLASQGGNKEDDEQLLPDQVILFVSGGLALYKQVELDANQRKHMATALPYLIEEDLAQDIESIHLVSAPHKKSDQVSLSVIPHEDMQALLALFDQIDMPLDRVLVETQFLEADPDFTIALMESQSVLLVSPDITGVCLDYDAAQLVLSGSQASDSEDTMLDELVGNSGQPHRSQVRLMFSDGDFAPSSECVESFKSQLNEKGWLMDEALLPGSVFDFLAQRYFHSRRKEGLTDLRQGAYQCPRRAGRHIRRWRPAAAVLACWFILELGLSSGQALFYQQQAETLWQQTMHDYLQLFPQDQQAKNAQAKNQTSFNVQKILENRLRISGRQQAGEPFLPLLQKVSGVSDQISSKDPLEHQSMDFNSGTGKMVLEFQTNKLETVDRFLAALKESGLQTKLDSANQGKNHVLARMVIGK